MTESLLKSILENHKYQKQDRRSSDLFPSNNDPNKLEAELISTKNSIQHDLIKLEKLNSKLHLLQQQNEIYSHESQVILEKIKDSNWAFTKDVCTQVGKIKKPTAELADLCEKFMFLLDQKEKSWKMFQAVIKNYDSLKILMNSFNPENIKEENVDLLLPIWKNYATISPILQKQSKGACILLDWITGCVEYKIKKATLNTIKRSILEIQNKIKDQLANLAEKNSVALTIEGKIAELKALNTQKSPNVTKKNFASNTNNNTNNNTHNNNTQGNEKHKSFSLNEKNHALLAPNHEQEAPKSTGQNLEKASSLKMLIDDNECNISKDFRSAKVNNVVNDIYSFAIKKKMSVSNTQLYLQTSLHGQPVSSASSPKHIQKIHNIIKANDPRNDKDVLIMNSKLIFAKETQQLPTFGADLKSDISCQKPKIDCMKYKPQQMSQDEINVIFLEEPNHSKCRIDEPNEFIKKSNMNSFISPNSHPISFHSYKSEETQIKSQKGIPNQIDYQTFQENLKVKVEEDAKRKNQIIEYNSQLHDDSTDNIGCVGRGIKLFCSTN